MEHLAGRRAQALRIVATLNQGPGRQEGRLGGGSGGHMHAQASHLLILPG